MRDSAYALYLRRRLSASGTLYEYLAHWDRNVTLREVKSLNMTMAQHRIKCLIIKEIF